MHDKELIIRSVHLSQDARSLKFDIHIDGETHPIFFRSTEARLTVNLEGIITAMLLPAMKTGSTIVADGPVSQRFLENLPVAQDILQTWDSSLHRVRVEGHSETQRSEGSDGRVGTFFTGGVDSFYTLIKQRQQISDLIFVHGYDIPLGQTALRAKTSAAIHQIASAYGKNVIELESNLEPFMQRYAGWVTFCMGPALAAAGHLLSPALKQIYFPASATYADLIPLSSHPMLDPLWSSEQLEFLHDGCEATRLRKVQIISEHEVAMEHLRVCWENRNQAYNCGRCEKCTRTMINLYVAGALDRCRTFDRPLTIRQVRSVGITERNRALYAPLYAENLEALEQANRPEDRVLREALAKVLKGTSSIGRLKTNIAKGLLEYPAVFRILRPLYRRIQAIFNRDSLVKY